MSFFAGNGKLHITRNTRSKAELDTDTIYPDTTFHSNMNVLCSLGEYQAQAYVADFIVKHGDFPSGPSIAEQCYEVAIPTAVVNALYDNYVVLVQINDGTREAAINFPLNIKTGMRGTTSSSDTDYAVAVAPQVTAGGKYDVCFSYSSIKNKTLQPKLGEIGNSGYYSGVEGVYYPTTKIMPWTLNPDYPSTAPNTLVAGARYAQIHYLGERWRLENTTVGNPASAFRRDNPTMGGLPPTAPVLTFIIVNTKFTDSTFTVERPFATGPDTGIKLSPGKVEVRGNNLTSIKVIQSYNPSASGAFSLSKSVNRLISCTRLKNHTIVQYDTNWLFKKYDSFIFSQGARYPNGALLLRPTIGGVAREVRYSLTNNSLYTFLDTVNKANLPNYSWVVGGVTLRELHKLYCTPSNGCFAETYPNVYYTDMDKLLLEPISTYSNAGSVSGSHFALTDTTKFTGIYVDKDGIKGTLNGSQIPIYNNASAPTYMIEVTALNNSATFSVVSEGVSEFTQDLMNIGASRAEESFLIAVSIPLGSKLLVSAVEYPRLELSSLEGRMVSDDLGGTTSGGRMYGLVKLADTEEVLLAHGYLNSSLKHYKAALVSSGYSGPRFDYTVTNTLYNAYITVSLSRSGSRLMIKTRTYMQKDRWVASNIGGAGYGNFTFVYANAPKITVAATRIQSI